MPGEALNLPRGKFEPVVSQPLELDALDTELSICFQNLDGPCEIKTCYGDICKIVNALRDYARMLRMVCGEWDLQGCHRAVYELHADKLEEISKKYQPALAAITTRLWRDVGRSARNSGGTMMWAARR